jgi:DNA processing protein
MSPNTSPSSETFQLLALSMLKGVGPSTLRKVVKVPGYASASISDLSSLITPIRRATESDNTWGEARRSAEEQVKRAEDNDAFIVSIADSSYPELLSKTTDDPCLLYAKGCLVKPGHEPVAVIGTRHPTKHGILITQRITEYLASVDRSVISGLALGCDAIAHQAAVDSKGHTVAVLAHGLQTIAPSKHQKLADDILASGGGLVSEFPFGTQPLPQLFVQRDKTQAGLASGVVMVQSDIQGGSLHASRAAISYGRWLAVPYPTTRDQEAGEPKIQANLLLANGSPTERADLLRCSVGMLGKVIILRGKDDYALLTNEEVGQYPNQNQNDLLL